MRTIVVNEFIKVIADPNDLSDQDKIIVSLSYNGKEHRIVIPYNNENIDNETQFRGLLIKAINKAEDMEKVSKQKIINLSNRVRGKYSVPNR